MKKYHNYSSFIAFVLLVIALPCVFFLSGWGKDVNKKTADSFQKGNQSVPFDTLISNLASQADTIGQLRLQINRQDSVIDVQSKILKAQQAAYIAQPKE